MPARALRDPKPAWLKVRAPGGPEYVRLKETLRALDLHTVCEEARCPNVGECWGAGTMTVMLLGHTCTRGCRFCAVTTGNPRGAVDPREPEHVARAIAALDLGYVVLTMVNRDDLLDGGAEHVASSVRALKRRKPDLLVETLVGDFQGRMRDVDVVLDSEPDVFAHNVEVTRRLTPRIRDRRSDYDQSLAVLARAKRQLAGGFVKSSIMVGIGERNDEVVETLEDLRAAGVDVVTIGQYLRPTSKHAEVARYVEPEQFSAWERLGLELGFSYVASGPLVRSSYHAAEAFLSARLRPSLAPTIDLPRAGPDREPHAPFALSAERESSDSAATLSPPPPTLSLGPGPQRTNGTTTTLLDPRSLVRRRAPHGR